MNNNQLSKYKIMKNMNLYAIFLFPKNKNFDPHIWIEGGLYKERKSAEFQAKQCRKQGLYEKVEVVDLIHKYN